MDRRRFLLTSLAGALAAPLAAEAQRMEKVYRIGALDPPTVALSGPRVDRQRDRYENAPPPPLFTTVSCEIQR
jgi:hypothetical protein